VLEVKKRALEILLKTKPGSVIISDYEIVDLGGAE